MYIDDDLDDISLFEEVIGAINPSYLVQSFSDSKTALAFLEENVLKPDIIFLDINMPVMNGKETLLLIRRNKNMADLPVIMYSTLIHGEDKNRFTELGANEFLKKSSHFEGMKGEINAIFHRFFTGKQPLSS